VSKFFRKERYKLPRENFSIMRKGEILNLLNPRLDSGKKLYIIIL